MIPATHSLADGATYGHLSLALGLGLLIGVERGWQARGQASGSRVAGVRTFGLLGLLGGIAGLLASGLGPLTALIVLIAVFYALLAGYRRDISGGANVSATSLVTAMLTLCLGMVATMVDAVLAVATAAVVTMLLASRKQLHGLLNRLGEADVQATARFAIITAVILPLLPDRRFGPYGAWNPHNLWLVVVLVTGFSFAGYIANKRFGVRGGTLVTAAIVGAYSSTAVTAELSRRLRRQDEPRPVLKAGIALASALMFVRVLVLAALLVPFALPSLALVLAPAAIFAFGASLWLVLRSRGAAGDASPMLGRTNPFDLLPALGFAALVAATALATRWAEAHYGDAGTAALITIAGSFDVDAAIATMSGLPVAGQAPRWAGLVLASPILINMIFKTAIVVVFGGWRRGAAVAAPLACCSGLLAVTLAWMWSIG